MNLESIIPPLKLCKIIPQGSFADSALVWKEFVTGMMYPPTDWGICARWQNNPSKECYPATTLSEVLAELITAGVGISGNVIMSNPYYTISTLPYDHDHEASDENPVTAAMRLWLKLQGIEVK